MANITKIYEIKLQGQGELLKEMKKVNDLFDKTKKNWEALKSTMNKSISQTELLKAKLEMEKLRQETIRLKNENIALGNAQRQQNINQRANSKSARETGGAYKQLSKELNEQRRILKDLDAGNPLAHMTAEYTRQLEVVKQLDSRLKQIDARAGQHRRNVGNYASGNVVGNNIQGCIVTGKQIGRAHV